MILLSACKPGSVINLFATGSGNLAELQEITNFLAKATFLGYYYNQYSSDYFLLGWLSRPISIKRIEITAPDSFIEAPLVCNPNDYKFFRWCSGERYVQSIDMDPNLPIKRVSAELKTGELSPNHVPGWHQCNCGFRNQDISETAFIAGKYVCHSCRYIWKK